MCIYIYVYIDIYIYIYIYIYMYMYTVYIYINTYFINIIIKLQATRAEGNGGYNPYTLKSS